MEYSCVPVMIAVKSENETASKARKIRNIIVAGGDQVVQATLFNKMNSKFSNVLLETHPSNPI